MNEDKLTYSTTEKFLGDKILELRDRIKNLEDKEYIVTMDPELESRLVALEKIPEQITEILAGAENENGLSNLLDTQTKRIDDIKDMVVAVVSEVGEMKETPHICLNTEQLKDIQTNLIQLNEIMGGLKEANADLRTTMDSVKKDLSTVKGKVTKLSKNVTILMTPEEDEEDG